MADKADEIVHAQPATLERLRGICLRFPEAIETGGVGNPSFKVREKIFAMQHGHQGRPSCWVKAPHGVQGMLVGHDPERFFAPPYVGQHGWVGVWIDGSVDWEELADLAEESYRMTAPKRLVEQLDH
ncbi:MAG: MmcQ/YjbR family DNA-binding protein [Gaiellaceae bacterium]